MWVGLRPSEVSDGTGVDVSHMSRKGILVVLFPDYREQSFWTALLFSEADVRHVS